MTTTYDAATKEEDFASSFYLLSQAIYRWAVEKGFRVDGVDRNIGEVLALVHSEISEATKAMRCGNPPDQHLPQYSSVEVELADAIIRIMDVAYARGWRVAEALIDKITFNKTRPYRHDKEF